MGVLLDQTICFHADSNLLFVSVSAFMGMSSGLKLPICHILNSLVDYLVFVFEARAYFVDARTLQQLLDRGLVRPATMCTNGILLISRHGAVSTPPLWAYSLKVVIKHTVFLY